MHPEVGKYIYSQLTKSYYSDPGRPLGKDDFDRASQLPPNPPRDASHIENMKMFQQLADGEVEANKHMTEPDLKYTMQFTKNGIHALEYCY